jgi:hypothetical protein
MNAELKTGAETLLKIAGRYETEGMSVFEAVELAADNLKLPVVEEGEACKVYATTDGPLENCFVG